MGNWLTRGYAGTRFLDGPVDGREVMDFAHDPDRISDDEDDDLGYYIMYLLLTCFVWLGPP